MHEKPIEGKWGSAARAIAAHARRLGFDAVGIAPASGDNKAKAQLQAFLVKNYQGGMGWLARTPEKRANPELYWQQTRSVIVVGLSYASADSGLEWREAKSQGWIASFARRDDYHPALKAKLAELGQFIEEQYGGRTKICVDDAPIMEKPLAALAGLGWQGKHTNLVSQAAGSWLFLGACLTDLPLPQSPPSENHCGSCRACLDICPTKAFPAPYRLDARKCISYLTIEHKGAIPRALRPAIGNRIFGCDDCLAVCPWNKFAKRARELNGEAKQALLPEQESLKLPSLAMLAQFDKPAFKKFFAKTGFIRLGFNRFGRNLMIAIGNSGMKDLLPHARARLEDASPIVRGAAIWACRQLAAPDQFNRLKQTHAPREQEGSVQQEWQG